MDEDWLTVADAAKLIGYHPDHLRVLIRAGRVNARKFGPMWQVSRSSLLGYLRTAEKLGEKRGPKGQRDT